MNNFCCGDILFFYLVAVILYLNKYLIDFGRHREGLPTFIQLQLYECHTEYKNHTNTHHSHGLTANRRKTI